MLVASGLIKAIDGASMISCTYNAPIQTVDVPFHGAVTPGQDDACFDCRVVALENFR